MYRTDEKRGIQPERMPTREEMDRLDELLASFCNGCSRQENCKGECVLQDFRRYVTPKAGVQYRGGRIWLEDGSLIRMGYRDGSIGTYSVNVIDVTHVELSGCAADSRASLTIHTMHLESILSRCAWIELSSPSGDGWKDIDDICKEQEED